MITSNRQFLPDGAIFGGWSRPVAGEDRLICELCPRECHLRPGDRGFCFVRENRDGRMVLSTYGKSTGFCVDPIEKKPLNHFYPGTSVLSFGTAGCNLGCKFCQNHDISKSREVARLSEAASPQAIAEAAKELGCRSVAFTYNDPVIWAEYAIDTARECRALGVQSVAVTAGYISPVAREPFFSAMDAANVDLKGFTEEFYQHLTLSHLAPVLETLVWLKRESSVWFEITNLIIPRANDSPDEIRRMCDWLLDSLGDDVPVHFTAFHPDFKLTDRSGTPSETLHAAYEQARRQGLKYVYVGNVHDIERQSTKCPACRKLLIERDWHSLGEYNLRTTSSGDGECEYCGEPIPGKFLDKPGDWGRKRQPVRIANYESRSTKARLPAMTKSTNHSASLLAPADVRAAPDWTPQQQRAIHLAACEILRSTTRRAAPRLDDPSLAGAAEMRVWGVFVSAKRRGQLRGCCGNFGGDLTLIDALSHAATRTASEDHRLPPLSSSELPRLDVEVWLLHSPQRVEAHGEARLEAVTIGRHGLQIAQGEKRGLLLPGVAVEHGYSAEAFLRQVCLKAGLTTFAWKEASCELATFEGVCFCGRFDEDPSMLAGEPPPRISAVDLERLAEHCQQNLFAYLAGGTPSFYAFNAFDGAVSGVSIAIVAPSGARMDFSKLSLRPLAPLQATLIELVEAAARTIRQRGEKSISKQWRVELTILDDAALAGSVAQHDLEGEPLGRALVVVERNKSAWMIDSQRPTVELLRDAERRLHIADAQRAATYTFRPYASAAPKAIVNQPQPFCGSPIRRAAVAGAFYPDAAEKLDDEISGLFGSSLPKLTCRAAMLPHAGWKYSGRIAAQTLSQIDFAPFSETVVVIGPKHTTDGVDWALAPHEWWEMPGGRVAADLPFADEWAKEVPGLQFDAAAHHREHAIEVELPLLSHVRPKMKLVALAIGAAGLEECRRIAQGLARIIARRERPPLLVISSDMNHFADDAETRRLDALALEAMQTLDASALLRVVRAHQISMCGVLPAVIVMEALSTLGVLKFCLRTGYATSADAGGDRSRVVGYAGALLG